MNYETFMLSTLPNLYAHLPGGLKYDYHASITLRVIEFQNAVKRVLEQALALGVDHNGTPCAKLITDDARFMERYINKGCPRNDRRTWARRMRDMGLEGDEWKRPVSYGDLAHWEMFRKEIRRQTTLVYRARSEAINRENQNVAGIPEVA